jgi:hypothetical protein
MFSTAESGLSSPEVSNETCVIDVWGRRFSGGSPGTGKLAEWGDIRPRLRPRPRLAETGVLFPELVSVQRLRAKPGIHKPSALKHGDSMLDAASVRHEFFVDREEAERESTDGINEFFKLKPINSNISLPNLEILPFSSN